jgi:hypothetical protein
MRERVYTASVVAEILLSEVRKTGGTGKLSQKRDKEEKQEMRATSKGGC